LPVLIIARPRRRIGVVLFSYLCWKLTGKGRAFLISTSRRSEKKGSRPVYPGGRRGGRQGGRRVSPPSCETCVTEKKGDGSAPTPSREEKTPVGGGKVPGVSPRRPVGLDGGEGDSPAIGRPQEKTSVQEKKKPRADIVVRVCKKHVARPEEGDTAKGKGHHVFWSPVTDKKKCPLAARDVPAGRGTASSASRKKKENGSKKSGLAMSLP